MSILLSLQLVCCVITFMLALTLAFTRLLMHNTSHRYETARWMLCSAMGILSIHYAVQMIYNLRASGDDIGAAINLLFYTPASFLISYSMYYLECGVKGCKRYLSAGIAGYIVILAIFFTGYAMYDGLHLGSLLYVMLVIFIGCMIFFIITNYRAIRHNSKNIASQTGQDLRSYDRYHLASITMLYAAALLISVALFSRSLLFIAAPIILFALFAFTMTFLGLGFKMMPIDLEEVLPGNASTGTYDALQNSPLKKSVADIGNLPKERMSIIGEAISNWRTAGGFRDSSANIITLAHSIQIPKEELSLFFDQYIHETFRTWIIDIRFKEAQHMLMERPESPEWVIATECGFSSYSHMLYVFKTKTKLSPEEWKERQR